MKYIVNDVSFDTVRDALHENGYGIDLAEDSRGVAFGAIWTEREFEGKNGVIGGYLVGTIARNEPNFAASFTLTMDEHNNDKERMATVLTYILRRKTMR